MKFTTAMKKFGAMTLTGIVLMSALAGCGSSSDAGTDSAAADQGSGSSAAASMSGAIDVVSREDGSGTRGAFIDCSASRPRTAMKRSTTPPRMRSSQTRRKS